MLDAILTAVLAVSGLIIIYHHAGFPLLLAWMARRARAQATAAPTAATQNAASLPSIRLIVPAHNEASVITAKIQNLLALFYPSDKLSIVIALDGCTDDTKAIVTSGS